MTNSQTMKAIFTGYKHIAGKLEQYGINAPGLSDIWAKADKAGRIRLVKQMQQRGGFDFITYYPAQSITNVVLSCEAGELETDEYGVTIGGF